MGRPSENPTATVQRRRVVVDVYLLLAKDGQVLLSKRDGTGYGDGAYEPPSGQLSDRETIVETAVRIAAGAALIIDQESVSLAHVMHDVSGSGRIAFFLTVSGWDGQEETETARWFPLDELPTNMLDRARVALRHYAGGERFSTYPAFGPAHLASLTRASMVTGAASADRSRCPARPGRPGRARSSSACPGSSGPAR